MDVSDHGDDCVQGGPPVTTLGRTTGYLKLSDRSIATCMGFIPCGSTDTDHRFSTNTSTAATKTHSTCVSFRVESTARRSWDRRSCNVGILLGPRAEALATSTVMSGDMPRTRSRTWSVIGTLCPARVYKCISIPCCFPIFTISVFLPINNKAHLLSSFHNWHYVFSTLDRQQHPRSPALSMNVDLLPPLIPLSQPPTSKQYTSAPQLPSFSPPNQLITRLDSDRTPPFTLTQTYRECYRARVARQ